MKKKIALVVLCSAVLAPASYGQNSVVLDSNTGDFDRTLFRAPYKMAGPSSTRAFNSSQPGKHKSGTYFTSPGDCDIKPAPLKATVTASDPAKTDGGDPNMQEIDVKPFNKLVLAYNSRFSIDVVKGAKPRVFVPKMSAVAMSAREFAVKQDGGTLYLTSYSSKFKVICSSLDEIRLVSNGTATIKGLNGGKIHIVVESNGTVWAKGKVDHAQVDVLQNGTAALQNLEAKNEVIVVKENGTAHANATEYLSATVLSNGGIYYSKLPARVDKNTGDFFTHTFEPESSAPGWRTARYEPEW